MPHSSCDLEKKANIYSYNLCGSKHNVHFTDNRDILLHQNVNFRNIILVCNLFIFPTYASSESYERTLSNNQEIDRKTGTDRFFLFVCLVGFRKAFDLLRFTHAICVTEFFLIFSLELAYQS